jgi:hypothetical protein
MCVLNEFAADLTARFANHISQTNEQATTESFLRFLLTIGVVHRDTPRYYMVVRQYPYELYRENARRFVAVQKLSVAYDVSERKIYELLSTNSKKNSTKLCNK